MSSNEKKAQQLIAEAKKKMGPRGILASFFGGSSHTDDAVECFQRAANLYKMSKCWSQAGSAFTEAATLHVRLGVRHDAAINYVDAANCYKKTDVKEAVNCLLKAIEIYTDMGRFTIAAKHHQAIAEMYESDAMNLNRSVEHYEQAADYFKGEESNSSANKCLLKVAQYAALVGNYHKSIEIYQQAATYALSSSLLKYSAKEYLFRAALCHLCVDLLDAQRALERYVQINPAFQDCREYKLVATLTEHLEEQNLDGFTDAVKDYDSISRLDEWYTTILLRIKNQINERPDLR